MNPLGTATATQIIDEAVFTTAYTAPFTCTASSTLSQDLYVTADLIMNPGDVVRPYANADGSTSALVLSAGTAYLLLRDASTSSGFTFSQVYGYDDLPITGATDAAVVTDGSGTTWVLVARPDTVYTGEASSPSTWLPATEPPPGDVLSWRSGLDPSGNAYFYAFNADSSINVIAPAQGPDLTLIPAFVSTIADGFLLWNPEQVANDPNPGWAITVDGDGVIGGYKFTDPLDVSTSRSFGDLVLTPLWATWPGPNATLPTLVGQFRAGEVDYLSDATGFVSLGTFSTVTTDQISVWFDDDLLACTLVQDGAVIAIAQYGAPADGTFTGGIQIDDGAETVCGWPGDPDQATLFVVGADATLGALVKDPVLQTWSAATVQQAAPTAQDLTSYRTTITIVDANGLTVQTGSVAVTADSSVGVWQPQGNLLLTPTTPLTFTPNRNGAVNLAIPAFDLDAARLTLQVLDATGSPVGDPVTVAPNGDAHDFLAGNAALPQLPTLTASTLISATSPQDGLPLSPTIAGLSGDQQTSAATAIVTTLNRCVAAGTSPGAPVGSVQSFLLDMSGPVPTYTESNDPNDPNTQPTGVSATGLAAGAWWDSMQHDLHSFEHSVRKGFTTVEQCGAQLLKDAETGVEQWVINLAVDVENLGTQLAQYVVDDVRSAVTAIHGVFHAIEVDAERLLNWLRMAFDDLLGHADANASVAEGWLAAIPTQATALLADLPRIATGWFASENAKVQGALADVATKTGDTSFSTYQPSGPDMPGLGDALKLMSYSPANWLIDKIESEFHDDSQPGVDSGGMTTALNTLISGAEAQGLEAFLAIGTDLWTAMSATIHHPTDIKDMAISTMLDVLSGLSQQLLELADDVVQALIKLVQQLVDDFQSMLSLAIDDVPLIGGVLSHFGLDTSSTVGHLFTLIAMFPTTLVWQLATSNTWPMFPTGASDAAVDDGGDPWAMALAMTHGGVRMLQGGGDVYADWQIDLSSSTGVDLTPGRYSGYLDTFCGLCEVIANWPGAKVNGLTQPPFTTAPPRSTELEQLWLARWACTALSPVISASLQIALAAGVKKTYAEWLPMLNGALYGSVFAIGVYWDVKSTTEPFTAMVRALEIAPRVISPTAMSQLNDAADYVPLGVKLMSDGFEAAAGLMIISAALPS